MYSAWQLPKQMKEDSRIPAYCKKKVVSIQTSIFPAPLQITSSLCTQSFDVPRGGSSIFHAARAVAASLSLVYG